MSNLHEVNVPLEKLARARQESIQKWGKRKHRQKIKMTVFTAAFTVATLFFILVATSKISPTVSSYVSSLPGMSWLKDEMKLDPTLEAIVKNDYFIPLNNSANDNNVSFTLKGLIADESNMRIYFEAKAKNKTPFPDYSLRIYENNEEVVASLTIPFDFDEDGVITDFIDVRFEEAFIKSNNIYEVRFTLKSGEEFVIPFTINQPIAVTKTIAINETITLQNQRLHVLVIETTPLKSIITFKADEENTMQILQIESLQLVDEKGKAYGNVENGLFARGDSRDESFQYVVQSNYYEEPEQLYLKIGNIQAVDKADAYLLITEQQEVIVPTNLTEWQAEIINNEFVLSENSKTKIRTSSIGAYIDANGKEINMYQFALGGDEDVETITIPLPQEGKAVYPLKVEILGYPNYLNEKPILLKIK